MFPLTADSELPDNNVSRLGRVAKQPMSHWIESGARLTRESLSKLVSLAELSIFRDMRERIIKCFYIYYLLLYVIYYLKERIIKCTSSNLLINWNNIVIWLVGIILFLNHFLKTLWMSFMLSFIFCFLFVFSFGAEFDGKSSAVVWMEDPTKGSLHFLTLHKTDLELFYTFLLIVH